jgi:hypothetical protein
MSAKKVPFASDGIDLGCFEAVIHDGQQWVDKTHSPIPGPGKRTKS